MKGRATTILVIIFLMFSASMLISISKAGTTWSLQTVASAGTVGLDTSIALDSSGHPHISYYDITNGYLKYASWSGSAWSFDTVDSTGNVGRSSSIALDSIGNPHISYYDVTNSHLKYASKSGSGWTNQTVDASSNVGQYSSLALDVSSFPYISYFDGANYALKYAAWMGSGWITTTRDSSGVGSDSSLALDSKGYPSISYYDIINGDLKYDSWNGSTWTIQTVDSTNNVGSHTSLALDSSGHPHISYFDITNGDLKYAIWTGSGWTKQTVDSTGQVGEYSSIALDSIGNPHISYYDYTKGYLKYAIWNGSIWAIQTLDSTGNVGLNTSLALDSIGNAHISYFDYTSGDLKYASSQASPPTGSIVIDSGATNTASISVTLTLSYTAYGSSVSQLRFSNDGTWDTEPWVSPTASKVWTLTSGDGTKTVYYQAKDSDGMLSPTYSDTIILQTLKVASPTFSPVGGTYSSSQSVTISCATSGSSIRYTTDGVDPTSTTGTVYSGAISVGSSQTLKARAFASGMTDSDVSSATYTINIAPPPSSKVASPTFSPVGGTYSSSQSVTISCATSGSSIRYTTDGVDPTSTTGTVYSGAISVGSSQTLKARAFASGMTDSDVSSATYTINITEVDKFPPTGTIQVNNGATKTTSKIITLNLAATDNSGTVAQMRFSNDNNTYSQWQAYGLTSAWTLSDGNGEKTVYAQFKDSAGNIDTASVVLTLDAGGSGNFPTELVIIAVAVVIVAVVIAFIIYKFLKRPKKPVSPAQIKVSAEPLNLTANGKEKSIITMKLLDKKGKPISAPSDIAVKVSAAKGRLEPANIIVSKGKDSEKTVLVSSTDVGPVPVSADADGLKSNTITLNFTERTRYCMHCGTQLVIKDNGCRNCGQSPPAGSDTKACQRCQAVIPAVAKFCSECGAGQAV